jgi:hypothetical protein
LERARPVSVALKYSRFMNCGELGSGGTGL